VALDIIFAYTIALGFIIATLKHLKSTRLIINESSYKMQKQLIFSLIIQVILENKANFSNNRSTGGRAIAVYPKVSSSESPKSSKPT
jgi:hypothetical protein